MAQRWTDEEKLKIKEAAQELKKGGVSILKLIFDLRCATRGNMHHRSIKTLLKKNQRSKDTNKETNKWQR